MGRMKEISQLEEAAYEWAEAHQAAQQATEAALPNDFVARLHWSANSALEALKDAAMRHFNNVYDGATE